MKYSYRFHYADYAIGENEHLYEKMAKKGLKLVKRGVMLSKFEKGAEENTRYRIELSTPGFLEDAELPEEQVALYEDCGWEFVTNHGLVHVFSAPEGSDAQEFYTDPRQQAATLKALRRNYCGGWISIAVVLGIHFLIAYGLASDSGNFFSGAWASLMLAWFRSTELVLVYAVLLASELYQQLYGTVRTALLYQRLKDGKPLDHTPQKRRMHRAITILFNVLLCMAFALLAVQLLGIEKYEMPLQTQEPYLTLAHDLGAPGNRDEMSWQSDGSTVERGHSLACEKMWFTHEHVGDRWLYQQLYLLRDEKQVENCVRMLMYNSTFAGAPERFAEAKIDGLDAVYLSGLDGIAVKGRLVTYITYSERCDEKLFEAMSAKLTG